MSDRDDKIEWLKLDNAAKIFPAARSSRWNNLFRCSAVLKSRVDKDILQESVEAAIKRYPMLQVSLRAGIFWYYFQSTDEVPKVQLEEDYPCSMLDLKNGKLLFRVLYSRNRISLEFFHSLTDGYGGVNFLNTILLKYFHLQGKKIPTGNILHYDDVPDEEEFEDSYKRYSKPELGVSNRKERAAFHMRGTKEIHGVLNVVQGEVNAQQLKDIAKSYNVNINQLVVGVAAYIAYKRKIYDNTKNGKLPVKISVAANLRAFMPSKSLRNFSAIANIEVKEEGKTLLAFEDVLRQTADCSKEIATEDNLYKFINGNIALEKNPFVRIVPLFLKSLIMKAAYYSFGEKLCTMSISNMGVVKTPEEYKDYVDRYEFVIGPQKYFNYAMSIGTFNDKAVINCSRQVKNSSFEREFFRFLSSLGLDVKVNSNKE